VKKGQLPKSVNPRRAAIGLHAYLYGLVANWVFDPKYCPLERDAARLVAPYLDGLKARGGG